MSKSQSKASLDVTSGGHVLPPEEEMPSEAPPSYEESLYRPRPAQGASSTSSAAPQNHPGPSHGHIQPPRSSSGHSKSPSPRPQQPNRYPPSPQNTQRPMGYNSNRPPQGPPPNNPLLHYPPGYFCPKCHNTGVKLKNSKSCQDCWGRFARPRQQVLNIPAPPQPYNPFPFFPFSPPPPQVTTTIYGAPGAPPPIVVQPGDPRLGGQVCGRCRGRGMIYDWLSGDENCPVCHGVGRVR